MPYENKIALERAHSAIIVDNYKLIKFYDNNDTKLYDVKNDISESIDLSKIYINERLTKKLEKILDNYLEEVKAPKWQPGITWKENTLKIREELKKVGIDLLKSIDDLTPNDIKQNFSMPLHDMIEKSESNLLRIIHYPPLIDEKDDKNSIILSDYINLYEDTLHFIFFYNVFALCLFSGWTY